MTHPTAGPAVSDPEARPGGGADDRPGTIPGTTPGTTPDAGAVTGAPRLSVLSVAYPLSMVSPDVAGGAEQVLAMLDRALVRAGHRSLVIACRGSRCAGELVAIPRPDEPLGDRARERAHAWAREAMARVLARERVDLVHLHGIDFLSYLPPPGPAVLVTLHLPPDWYPPAAFALRRPRTHLCCVSASQRQRCPDSPLLLGVVDNGVDLDLLRPGGARQAYALAVGRICPEKGLHHALAACRRAGVPMLLAGQVFAYPEHERYFRERIVPLLDAQRRFIGPVGRRRKQRLMAAARCLLVPSEVAETSSLVAMEALACGTPVITSGAGALRELVEHGRTGFVVADEAGMAAAIHRVQEIDPAVCRRTAEERFSAADMAARYIALYRRCAMAGHRATT